MKDITNLVLLVEDSKEMQLIVRAAIGQSCNLTCVETIGAAEEYLRAQFCSLLILDVNLPDGDGFEFCKQLRDTKTHQDLPIIFLTTESEIESRVLGFRIGADDYVTKPIEPKEFTARVEAKLKRNAKLRSSIAMGGYRLDIALQKAFELRDDNTERLLPLTPIEFKILVRLIEAAGSIITRQDLFETVWGKGVHVAGNTVDTHISSLRKKLGESGASIRSVFGKGFRFGHIDDLDESEKDES